MLSKAALTSQYRIAWAKKQCFPEESDEADGIMFTFLKVIRGLLWFALYSVKYVCILPEDF